MLITDANISELMDINTGKEDEATVVAEVDLVDESNLMPKDAPYLQEYAEYINDFYRQLHNNLQNSLAHKIALEMVPIKNIKDIEKRNEAIFELQKKVRSEISSFDTLWNNGDVAVPQFIREFARKYEVEGHYYMTYEWYISQKEAQAADGQEA